MPRREWRTAIALALAIKAASLLCLYAGYRLVPQAGYGADLWIVRPGVSFVDHLANFDGAWFARIAALGYRRLAAGDYDLAAETRRLRVMDQLGYDQARWPPAPGSARFDRGYGYRHWPLLPGLIRAASASGLDPVHAGVALSNLFTVGYGILLYYLVRLDHEKKTAVLAVALSQLHPGAYALSAVFNESLFLVLAAGAMVCARRGRWWAAGALAMIAAVSRIDGAILAVPLCYEWLLARAREDGRDGFAGVLGASNLRRAFHGFIELPGVWWALLIPLGTLSVIVYFYAITGDALIWTRVHEVNVHGHVNWPWLMMMETYEKGPEIWMKELPLHAVLLLTLVLSFRKTRGSYWAWMLVFFLYHASNANHSYLRYQVQCLPMFIALAQVLGRWRWLAALALISFAALFALFAALFINGYWVA
ncbi:MAG TPA: hypothetical protein VM658_14645 [bacterium]|nr:hypothetical protein [bacterium]